MDVAWIKIVNQAPQEERQRLYRLCELLDDEVGVLGPFIIGQQLKVWEGEFNIDSYPLLFQRIKIAISGLFGPKRAEAILIPLREVMNEDLSSYSGFDEIPEQERPFDTGGMQ